MLITVAGCHYLWSTGPHKIPGVMFPAISEMGVATPERYLYQVGFAICGAILSVGILLWEELVGPEILKSASAVPLTAQLKQGAVVQMPGETKGVLQTVDASTGRWTVRMQDGTTQVAEAQQLRVVSRERSENALEPAPALLNRSLWWGHAASTGVALQGIFTLKHEIDAQCFVHWGGAVLFMAGALQHGKACNELYDRAQAGKKSPLLTGSWVKLAVRIRHCIVEYSSLVMFMVPLLMQFFPAEPKEPGTTEEERQLESEPRSKVAAKAAEIDPRMMNAMGLMQWGIILQFAVFFSHLHG